MVAFLQRTKNSHLRMLQEKKLRGYKSFGFGDEKEDLIVADGEGVEEGEDAFLARIDEALADLNEPMAQEEDADADEADSAEDTATSKPSTATRPTISDLARPKAALPGEPVSKLRSSFRKTVKRSDDNREKVRAKYRARCYAAAQGMSCVEACLDVNGDGTPKSKEINLPEVKDPKATEPLWALKKAQIENAHRPEPGLPFEDPDIAVPNKSTFVDDGLKRKMTRVPKNGEEEGRGSE
jgi:hypothetical protein